MNETAHAAPEALDNRTSLNATIGKRKARDWSFALSVLAVACVACWFLLPELVSSTDTRFIGALGVTFTVASFLWLATTPIIRRFASLQVLISIIQYALMTTGAAITYWALLRDGGFEWADLGLTALLGFVMAVALLVGCWMIGPWRPYTPLREVRLSMAKRAISVLDDEAMRKLQLHIDASRTNLDSRGPRHVTGEQVTVPAKGRRAATPALARQAPRAIAKRLSQFHAFDGEDRVDGVGSGGDNGAKDEQRPRVGEGPSVMANQRDNGHSGCHDVPVDNDGPDPAQGGVYPGAHCEVGQGGEGQDEGFDGTDDGGRQAGGHDRPEKRG